MVDTLRELLASRGRPDDGAPPPSASRLLALVSTAGAVLTLALLPLSEPTDALGWVGWPLAGAFVAGQLAAVAWLLLGRAGDERAGVLAMTYLGVAQVAAIQWLAGGAAAPYDVLLLLWLAAGVAVRPSRRGALFTVPVAAAWLLPLAYQHLDRHAVAALVGEAAVAVAIGLAVSFLVVRLRAQGAALRSIARHARAQADEALTRARSLEAVADAALAEPPPDELLSELLRRVTEAVPVEGAAVFVRDAEAERLALRATRGERARSWWEAGGRSLAERVASEGRAGSVSDGGPRDGGEAGSSSPAASLTAVPMLVQGGRVLGVLAVAGSSGRSFSDDETRFLQLAADRVAAAIDRRRLHEQAHRIAETLQLSLLPSRMPEPPGVALATRYRPGAAGTRVGGDLYDVVCYPDGRLGLAIGDVVGHGVEAASLMGRLRTAVQVFALEGDPPERLLERVNRLVARWEEGRFATLAYLVYDPRDSTLTFSSAGHLPPLVRAPDGAVSHLEGAESVPLGVLPLGEYRAERVELAPGSTLVLYTDGLVEERGVSLDRGLARLQEAVEGGPAELEPLCDHLLATVPPTAEGADDVAILAMRVEVVPAGPLELRLPARPESLSVSRRALERWLGAAGASPDAIHDILVACGEACANVVQHAYGRFARGEISLSASRAGGDVEIVVRDFGHWRQSRHGDGRGLELIRRLTASAQIVPGAEGTTVRMRRPLAGSLVR